MPSQFNNTLAKLGGDYMIPVGGKLRPAGTDFTLNHMVKLNFIPATRDSIPPGICLDLCTFSLNCSLYACQFTKTIDSQNNEILQRHLLTLFLID